MSEEATRAVVARWFGALDAGNVDAAMACLADNVRWINSPAQEGKPGGIPGLSAIIPWLGDFEQGRCHRDIRPVGQRGRRRSVMNA
jgi:ketosteroid isomerase-like protein